MRDEAGVDAARRRTAGPRAVVVAGMGGSGIAGDILAAVCGSGAPLPIVTVRSYRLPGWVGATDLVIAVSCSGETEETLGVADRGRAPRLPLLVRRAARTRRWRRWPPGGRAVYVPVPTRRAAPGQPLAG